MGRGVVDGPEKENVPLFGDAGGGVSEEDALRYALCALLSFRLIADFALYFLAGWKYKIQDLTPVMTPMTMTRRR